jgi:hypothetical protein
MSGVIIICIASLINSGKAKSELQRVDGTIIHISNAHEQYPGKDSTRFRFIEIDRYPKPFELFIGQGVGDFSAEFEHSDHLGMGDSITVYYRETEKTTAAPTNNLVHYIDRGNESIFVLGNAKKSLIYSIIVFCIALSLVLAILKYAGKVN